MAVKVLIVDDSRLIRAMIADVIHTNFPDWEIMEAEDSLRAASVLRKREVDIVTVDINMPGVDGLFLVEDIQSLQPKAKIAVISGSLRKSDQHRARLLNVEYLTKPVNEDIILGFLRAALAQIDDGGN